MAHGHKTGGRTKGTPNRNTAAIREALTETFDRLGGVEALTAWGRENPNCFYALWAKLLPREIKADVDASVTSNLAERLEAARERVRCREVL